LLLAVRFGFHGRAGERERCWATGSAEVVVHAVRTCNVC